MGDGLCCTDAHVLGPVTRAEAARISAVRPGAVIQNRTLAIAALRTEGGSCVFLGEGGCSLHRERGAAFKPATCRHFPVGLVATPHGGRVTTEHRCPCRTMGERPPLDAAEAARSLTEGGERLVAHARVGTDIALDASRRVPFALYEALEGEMLGGLAAGKAIEDVLGIEAFSPLQTIVWSDVGHHLRGRLDGTASTTALAWAGDAVLALTDGLRTRPRDRPWKPAFDRAERRSVEGDPEAIFADWVADEIWNLSWTTTATLSVAKASIASRLAIARWVAMRLRAEGTRPDRAAAEGVLVGEMSGAATLWDSVLDALH
jgi:hypothetical protein